MFRSRSSLLPGGLFFFAVLLWFGWTVGTSSLDHLPPRIATHFGPDGTADGWADKFTFRSTFVILSLLVPGFIILVTWSIRFLPENAINLPNRDFWLSPENKDATCSAISEFGLRTAALVLVPFSLIYRAVIDANTTRPPRLDFSFYWIFIPVAGTVFLIIALIRRFSVRSRDVPSRFSS